MLENAVIENGFKLRLASQSFKQHPLSRVKFSIYTSLAKLLVRKNKHILRTNLIFFYLQLKGIDGMNLLASLAYTKH